jgi:hypothetical protein
MKGYRYHRVYKRGKVGADVGGGGRGSGEEFIVCFLESAVDRPKVPSVRSEIWRGYLGR